MPTARSSLTTQASSLSAGIRANRGQFALQLSLVFCVGLTMGMMRTVVPAVAEEEFGLPRNAIGFLAAFVIAFGVVKAVMNFIAGTASERIGRRRVLVIGWLIALPIPFMIRFGPTWNWIVAATVLLGVNQGLAWSMTLTSKLDLAHQSQRGLVNGLNEFFGYFAVAAAGVVTGYLSHEMGARAGLFVFGLAVIVPALMIAALFVRDTRPWAQLEQMSKADGGTQGTTRVIGQRRIGPRRLGSDARFFAICQAGLIEKFVDALIWMFLPVLLTARGVSLAHVGWIPAVYAAVWGAGQLFTGWLSDRIGRRLPILWGLLACAAGVALIVVRDGVAWWASCAAITGLGMALLYPNLSAAISDIAPPNARAKALGIYRFWRDLGYAVGAFSLAFVAVWSGELETAFWFVSASMIASAMIVWLLGRETLPE